MMIKYIHMLIGAILIAGGTGYIDMNTTFYACGIMFVAAGLGEILTGE
jgi:hypothetical protein